MLKLIYVFLLCLFVTFKANAFESFVVEDIKTEGLERISLGTFLNYLPITTGEVLDDMRSNNVINTLFKTGFFNDIVLYRRNNILIISVVERPSIASLEISGNKDVETEQLMGALKNIGLVKGEVYDRSALEQVELELEKQYFNQGKYGVKITSTVDELDDARVDIKIDIDEGRVTTIHQINIVGNKAFDRKTILNKLELSPSEIFSSDIQYSKYKLTADLETLRSYYMDRGFISFNIESTQVTITPDKKDMFVTVNLVEGEKYSIKEVSLSGDLILTEGEIFELITIKSGDLFSRKKLVESTNAIIERLGDEGYAFSNVNASPEIDKENRLVSLTFFIDPGKRVYVRRINISGNEKSRDDVIRREVRQMEGGWISTKQLDRSRVRLNRLGYFEEVNIETPSVSGLDDQMDVELSLTERPSGTLTAGLGYSQADGFLLNASISQDNFLGTGKRISSSVNNSDVNTVYSFSYINPYHTIDGVSRGINMFFRQTDAGEANIAEYLTDTYGADVSYGFPLSEDNRANISLGYENTVIKTTASTPQSFIDYIGANTGDFDIIKLIAGWSHDTRNRAVFADEGVNHSLSTEIALPGSGLEYYKVGYRGLGYIPLTDSLTMLLRLNIGYGDSYSDTTALPFFEHYTAGGSSSVRGYRSNSLGPREDGKATGGAYKLVANGEIIFPVPFAEESKSLRLSAFVDVGNVFKDRDAIDVNELRYSSGISLVWITPIVPMTFSYAKPLNEKEGDSLERFQFTLGSFLF